VLAEGGMPDLVVRGFGTRVGRGIPQGFTINTANTSNRKPLVSPILNCCGGRDPPSGERPSRRV